MSMLVVVSHIFSLCVLAAHLVVNKHLSGLGTLRQWPLGWGSSSRPFDVVRMWKTLIVPVVCLVCVCKCRQDW